jgi:dTDP-4-amino-4,6-dideoxygalactose transaminase
MELGSEFNLSLSGLKLTEHNLFSYLNEFQNKIYFDSGRSALKYIARSIPKDGITLLPEFICESVIDCFDRRRIRFYKIEPDFTIDMENIKAQVTPDVKVIFLMHYFGMVQPSDKLDALKRTAQEQGIIIIEDATHSIFSKKRTIGDYVISSIRKWMPLPKGGVLYTADNVLGIEMEKSDLPVSTENERVAAMILKDLFLKDFLDCNAEYRKMFADCENALDKQKEIYRISDLSGFMISCTDIGEIALRRKRNYQFLEEQMACHDISPACSLKPDDCPLVFPIRIRQRNMFRKYLMDHKIYCAVHWPFDGMMEETRTFAAENAASLISLPIDQRYGEDEMRYMVKVISEYRGA